MMEYKGYTAGPIDFDAEDGTFSGTVAGLRDVIHFEGTTARELKKAFRESIDGYLKFCFESSHRRPQFYTGARRVMMVCCAIVLSHAVFAQADNKAINLSESAARRQIKQKVDPIYPPIAKAAQVTGNVVVAATIDLEGKVISEKVVSGPPMLQQAALDAVKQWRFTPFKLNGAAVSVVTTFTIPFELQQQGPQPTKEQAEAGQAYFPLSERCRSALKSQNEQDAMDFCKRALDASLKAGELTPSDQLVSVEAHQDYGHALLLAKKAQEALDEENLAVNAARKRLTDKQEEYAGPFFWRAIAEIALGRQDAALSDFQIAEDTLRRAIVDLPELKKSYSEYLASVLRNHAAYLDLLGRPSDAEKLRAEAATL